jgi:UDP-glucose 4-epimerase
MNLSGSRIAVIGGAGLIGSHLVDQLTREDVEIVVIDNLVRGRKENLAEALKSHKVKLVLVDIRNKEELLKAMAGSDYVVHLAALWLLQCQEDPRACLEVNVVGTQNVIETARDLNVKRIVFSSSASVYGEPSYLPMDEKHPFNNRTAYGASKIAGEQMLRAFYEMYGLNYVGLRYFNVYGPRQDHRGAYVSVFMRFLDRIDKGEPPVLFGDGSQTMDFIYVEDVARSNLLALKAEATDANFNIASGTETSLNDLAKLLLRLTGSSLQPIYKKDANPGVQKRKAGVERAKTDLGFEAAIPLEEGLNKLIAWRMKARAKGT